MSVALVHCHAAQNRPHTARTHCRAPPCTGAAIPEPPCIRCHAPPQPTYGMVPAPTGGGLGVSGGCRVIKPPILKVTLTIARRPPDRQHGKSRRACRPPAAANEHPPTVRFYGLPQSLLCVACMCFGVAHGVGVLFALNIYDNAQAVSLMILHIARHV